MTTKAPAHPDALASQRFDGAVAIVTGGAGAIGREIVKVLASRGAVCRIADLGDGSSAAAELRGEGMSVDFVRLDITKRDEVQKYVQATAESLGPVSILVNCAGMGRLVGFLETDADTWESQIAVNLSGAFYLMQAVLPGMIAAGGGAIVNVASMSGVIGGVPSRGTGGRSGPAYAAAKAGLIGLTKWAAREFGNKGVKCNAVAPGPILPTAVNDYGVEDYPLPRKGVPRDVAEAVAYLASPACSWTTGECLKVSGGLGM